MLHLCDIVILHSPKCIPLVATLVCGLQPNGQVVAWSVEMLLEEGGKKEEGKRNAGKEGRERKGEGRSRQRRRKGEEEMEERKGGERERGV